MNDVQQFIPMLVPAITGVIQVLKGSFPFIKKHAPLLALLAGMALVMGAMPLTVESAVRGVEVGLAASGLQAGMKHYTQKKE